MSDGERIIRAIAWLVFVAGGTSSAISQNWPGVVWCLGVMALLEWEEARSKPHHEGNAK